MFSYEDYKEIIRIVQSTGNQAGYEEALKADKFVIMRHDVEYSVDRAYALAKVESSMDFTSTFFFQWTNNSYNILSKKNMDMIVANNVKVPGAGFGVDTNVVTLITESISTALPLQSKDDVAMHIADVIVEAKRRKQKK